MVFLFFILSVFLTGYNNSFGTGESNSPNPESTISIYYKESVNSTFDNGVVRQLHEKQQNLDQSRSHFSREFYNTIEEAQSNVNKTYFYFDGQNWYASTNWFMSCSYLNCLVALWMRWTMNAQQLLVSSYDPTNIAPAPIVPGKIEVTDIESVVTRPLFIANKVIQVPHQETEYTIGTQEFVSISGIASAVDVVTHQVHRSDDESVMPVTNYGTGMVWTVSDTFSQHNDHVTPPRTHGTHDFSDVETTPGPPSPRTYRLQRPVVPPLFKLPDPDTTEQRQVRQKQPCYLTVAQQIQNLQHCIDYLNAFAVTKDTTQQRLYDVLIEMKKLVNSVQVKNSALRIQCVFAQGILISCDFAHKQLTQQDVRTNTKRIKEVFSSKYERCIVEIQLLSKHSPRAM